MYLIDPNLLNRPLKVALIGVGGSGSAMATELIQLDTTLRALSSMCGLQVTVYDPSIVTQANIARQTFFETQVGMNKAEAICWTANCLHGKNWVAVGKCFEPNAFNRFDIIITAVDKPSVRYNLYQSAKNDKKCLWLDLGNGSTTGQVVLGELGKDSLLPCICDLYDYTELSDEQGNTKSCSANESLLRQSLGVNHTAARLGAQVLWNLFRYGQLKTHGAHFDVESLEVTPIEANPETWLMYGYRQTSDEQSN
ncbi:PRTRC system ThiF family protein [Vibrio mediterranei]